MTACFMRCFKNPDASIFFNPWRQPVARISVRTRIRVRLRLPFSLSWLLGLLLAGMLLAPAGARAAEQIDLLEARLENSDDGYKLAATFSFDLNHGLEDALSRGVPLYFTTDVEITRPRWYWFDEKTIRATQTVRISYNVLTRRYHAGAAGQLQQSFNTLEDALALIRRPTRWVVAEKNVLKAGETYRVALRMGLDVAQLPKPFQINALNNSDWRLSSDWKSFNFRAE